MPACKNSDKIDHSSCGGILLLLGTKLYPLLFCQT